MVKILRHLAMASAVVVFAIPAAGQEADSQAHSSSPGRSFEALNRQIKTNQTIYVMDPQGRETEGKLIGVSPSSVTMLVRGTERDVRRNEIVRVTRRGDALGNGIGISAGIFGGWAIISLASTGCASDVAFCAAVTGWMTGIGASIGALVDYSMKGRTVESSRRRTRGDDVADPWRRHTRSARCDSILTTSPAGPPR